MPAELLLTNIGFTVSIVVSLSLGVLVLVKRPRTGGAVNIVFFLTSLMAAIWEASYVIGVNIHDPGLSRLVLMFNLSTLFLLIFNAQLILVLADRFAPKKRLFFFLYVIAALIVIFYALFPDTFLLPSQPALYFVNFFVPGRLYEVQDVYFFMLLAYSLYEIFVSYRRATYIQRQRLTYFIIGYIFGYGVSLFPEFLVYGINVDPILTSIVGLYTVPMAYAILKYDLLNLNILAKKAFGYALSIAGVTLFILLIGYANDYITQFIPDFPQWFIPLCSGIIAVGVGVAAWNKIKEVDVLKYQFITVVTHKFRTPLTHIKWTVENLRAEPGAPQERIQALNEIATADVRLTELTNTLLGVSASEDSQINYSFATAQPKELVEEVCASSKDKLNEKHISLDLLISDNLPDVWIDKKKTQFVLQMILENAVTYSPAENKVVILVELKKGQIVISIKDFGIGIGPEDMPRIFQKFFRSSAALKTYTEGLGIGLFLARDIMRRQGGDVWAESAGVGAGSTFFVSMPLKK